ncbi:MAG: hypothetical protein AAFZ01_04860 [Pseudomonadota bacterium]
MWTLTARSHATLVALAAAVTMVAVPLAPASAGEVEIVTAEAKPEANGRFTVSVTLKHGDEGWDHYANAWDVVDAKGTVLGKRTLYHPHVEEQPFTRSLSGVTIPADVTTVTVRAYDSVHGRSKVTYDVTLPGRRADQESVEKTGQTAAAEVTAPTAKEKKVTKVRKKVVSKKRVRNRKVVVKRKVRRKAVVKRKARKTTRKVRKKVRRGSY